MKMNIVAALIASVQGMLYQGRTRIMPQVHTPTQEEIKAHQKKNPPFKRRKK